MRAKLMHAAAEAVAACAVAVLAPVLLLLALCARIKGGTK